MHIQKIGGNRHLHSESKLREPEGTIQSGFKSHSDTDTDKTTLSHVEKPGDDFEVGVQALLSLAGTSQQAQIANQVHVPAETLACPLAYANSNLDVEKISWVGQHRESETVQTKSSRQSNYGKDHIPTSSWACELIPVSLQAGPMLFWVGLDEQGNPIPVLPEKTSQAAPYLVDSIGESDCENNNRIPKGPQDIPVTAKRKRTDQKLPHDDCDSPIQMKVTRVEIQDAEDEYVESKVNRYSHAIVVHELLGYPKDPSSQGNLRFSVLLENYIKVYKETHAPTNGHIVMAMIDVLRSHEGRFLVAIQGGLREVARCSVEPRNVIAEVQTTTKFTTYQLIQFVESPEATISRHVKIDSDFVNKCYPLSHNHLCDDSGKDADLDPCLHWRKRHIDACRTDSDMNATGEADPELLQASLNLLDREIEQRKAECGAAYLLAERENPAFVQDRKFRIMCLRYCNFNCKDAALHLFDFLEAKLKFFGADKVAQRITLSNMGAGARAVLEEGHVQILSTKDVGGHQIIFNNVKHLGGYEGGDDMLRLLWYLTSIAIEDDNVQRKGIVYIQFNRCPQLGREAPQMDFLWNGLVAIKSFPCKLGSAHFVFDKTGMPLQWLFRFARTRWSTRLHIYEGTLKENIDALSVFGIASEEVPIGEDGQMLLEKHKNWLRSRQILESSQEVVRLNDDNGRAILYPTLGVQLITHPLNVDVLMGRGKRMQDHAGNIRLRSILEMHLDAYTKSRRSKKKEVAQVVVEEVQKGGGRFLRPTGEDSWVVSDLDSSKKKVIHDFRTIRGILKKQQNEAG